MGTVKDCGIIHPCQYLVFCLGFNFLGPTHSLRTPTPKILRSLQGLTGNRIRARQALGVSEYFNCLHLAQICAVLDKTIIHGLAYPKPKLEIYDLRVSHIVVCLHF